MKKDKLIKLLSHANNKKVLVIGDIIIDEYIMGHVSRISPEAPVPVVEVQKQSYSPGGASYVASIVKELGAKAYLAGIIGEDSLGDHIKSELEGKGVDTSLIIKDSDRFTTLKTRVIANHQQVVRIDYEKKDILTSSVVDRILERIKSIVKDIDAVIISDYNKGVVNLRLLTQVIRMCRKYGVAIAVDPKPPHYLMYKKVDVITPNTYEAGMLSHVHITDEKSLKTAGRKLLSSLGCRAVLVTRGESGMTLFEKHGDITHIPTVAKEIYDVTGAGDVVIATLALGLAIKANMKESARLANYAAGISVAKLGAASVTKDEIIQSIKNAG